MLDGLDEVPFERRTDFWKFVRRISKRYPTARILITSRNLSHTHNSSGLYKDPLELSDSEFVKSKHEWDPPAGFLDFRVKGLSREDISLFVDKWHAGIDIAKLPSGIGSGVDEIASQLKLKLLDSGEDESLAELSSTPMLCALLCMVNLLEGGKLPITPRRLYKAALEILIRTRDELRGVPIEPKYEEVTLRQRQRILECIAFFMQDAAFKDGHYLVEAKKADVASIIKLYQERPDGEPISDFESSDILEFLINRTAVIREPTTGFIDFSHRSFMEYLAAEHFVLNIPKMQISQYCQRDQWHGTLRFLTNSEAGGVAYNGIEPPLVCRRPRSKDTGLWKRTNVETDIHQKCASVLCGWCSSIKANLRASLLRLNQLRLRLVVGVTLCGRGCDGLKPIVVDVMA